MKIILELQRICETSEKKFNIENQFKINSSIFKANLSLINQIICNLSF